MLTFPPAVTKMAKGPLAGVDSYATSATANSGSGGLSVGFLDISGDSPSPGTGVYYVFRSTGSGGNCGSWQTAIGAEAVRDTVVAVVFHYWIVPFAPMSPTAPDERTRAETNTRPTDTSTRRPTFWSA